MTKQHRRKGQALVMVTFAIFAMLGLVGLAVDFGWAFYVEKTAQAAADAAALAAVTAVLQSGVPIGGAVCGTTYGGVTIGCAPAPVDCPGGAGIAGTSLFNACKYAEQNGFDPTTNSRQRVRVQASDAGTPPTVQACSVEAINGCSAVGCASINVRHAPTAPCVDTVYWVTVRTVQSVPQIFSAFMGNPEGLVSARATAAVAKAAAIGSLILLNREGDAAPAGFDARNLDAGGSGFIDVPGGIILAAAVANAGYAAGSSTVKAPFTWRRSGGDVQLGGSATWTAPPSTRADGGPFYDPFRGRGQPPLDPSTPSLPQHQVPIVSNKAELNSTVVDPSTGLPICPGGVCPPGIYYAVDPANGNAATGQQIAISSDIEFKRTGGATQFGEYVMFGGLNIGQATVRFGPGRYVLAGVQPPGGGGPMPMLLNNDNRAQLLSNYAGSKDPGRIFILTSTSYNQTLIDTVANIPNKAWNLVYGSSSIKSGNNDTSKVELNGLNPSHADLPSNLQNFTPVLLWQDQQNSNVEYTPEGQIDYTSCGGGFTFNAPCAGYDNTSIPGVDAPNGTSPKLEVWATPNTRYDGAIYQPRGAYTVFQASGKYAGALSIITGAMKVQGTPDLTLVGPTNPVTSFVAALVE